MIRWCQYEYVVHIFPSQDALWLSTRHSLGCTLRRYVRKHVGPKPGRSFCHISQPTPSLGQRRTVCESLELRSHRSDSPPAEPKSRTVWPWVCCGPTGSAWERAQQREPQRDLKWAPFRQKEHHMLRQDSTFKYLQQKKSSSALKLPYTRCNMFLF